MAKLKELLNQTIPKNDGAHATMLGVIGGYLVYLAYQMIRDTSSGVSSMDMTTTVVLAGLMALAGLGVMAFALRLWRKSEAAKKEPEAEA